MNGLFLALLNFYIIIVIGYLFGRLLKRYNRELQKILSFILLFILSPPLILFAFLIPNDSVNAIVIINIIVAQLVLVSATQIIAYLFIIRKKGKDENPRKGAILSLVAFPNAFLFPLPIVLSLFGPSFIIILVIFSISAMILRYTILTYESIYYGKMNSISLTQNLKEILTFPPTITLILSAILFASGIRINQEIFLTLNNFLSILTSLIGAILIGVLLININFNKIFIFKRDFISVALIRIGFSILLFLLIVNFLIFPPAIHKIVLVIILLLFIDPPAVTNVSFSEFFELDTEFTGFCVFTITILAIIYIPIFIILALALL